MEDLQEELSKEVVWPNRLILPLSSAADPRQVSEMQQVSRCFVSRCIISTGNGQVWQPQPGGFLCARLRSVSGLPKKSEAKKSFA